MSFQPRGNHEDKAIELAEQLCEDAKTMIECKLKCEYLVTNYIDELREGSRKNIGYDMALLELLKDGFLKKEDREEAWQWYKTWRELETKCKKAEKLMDTILSKMSYDQSKMRITNKIGG